MMWGIIQCEASWGMWIMEFNDCSFEGMGAASERRHGLRMERPMEAHLFPDNGADEPTDELEVSSLSLNRFGVGLDIPHDLQVGRVYNMEIGLNGRKVQSQVRIISCDPVADGLYRAGGEFC